MPKDQYKPVLVPTIHSLRTVLWSLALVAVAGALVWTYNAWDNYRKAREKLDEPVATVVDMPLFRVTLPPLWETYAKAGDTLFAFRRFPQAL